VRTALQRERRTPPSTCPKKNQQVKIFEPFNEQYKSPKQPQEKDAPTFLFLKLFISRKREYIFCELASIEPAPHEIG
jgi:hypothetical protein